MFNKSLTLKFSEAVRQKSFVIDLLQIIGGSLFIALCARIVIPLPFSPVPITGQTFAVLMLGVTLGKYKGMLSALAYIAEICMGFPVLAGGIVNTAALFGIRGGYIAGYVVEAFLAGFFAERLHSRGFLYVGLAFSSAVQLLCGTGLLATFIGWEKAFLVGFLPFIFTDMILKSLAIAFYFRKA